MRDVGPSSKTHHVESSSENQHVEFVLLARLAKESLLRNRVDGISDQVHVRTPQSGKVSSAQKISSDFGESSLETTHGSMMTRLQPKGYSSE